jgi:hypothetical protein
MLDRQNVFNSTIARRQNGDGGWGYFPHKSSRIEPTAWVAFGQSAWSEQARGWLADRLDSEGWLVEPGLPVNYGFNGLALMALLGRSSDTTVANRVSAGLVGVKGLAIAQSPVLRQDNSIRAWSWVAETFSWVEPTAYCLLALKRARTLGVVRAGAVAARIDDAERLLADRTCAGGGWNYGNAHVFDKDLRPYAPTTALALLALQDRRDLPCVQTGLQVLTAHADRERSGLALALTLICLRVFGAEAAALARAASLQADTSLAIGNLAVVGALAVALSEDDHAVAAFRV